MGPFNAQGAHGLDWEAGKALPATALMVSWGLSAVGLLIAPSPEGKVPTRVRSAWGTSKKRGAYRFLNQKQKALPVTALMVSGALSAV